MFSKLKFHQRFGLIITWLNQPMGLHTKDQIWLKSTKILIFIKKVAIKSKNTQPQIYFTGKLICPEKKQSCGRLTPCYFRSFEFPKMKFITIIKREKIIPFRLFQTKMSSSKYKCSTLEILERHGSIMTMAGI